MRPLTTEIKHGSGAAPSGEPLPFETLAESVLGPTWRTRLIKTFGVNKRTVERWVSGQNAPPQAIFDLLYDLQATIERYRRPV